MKGHGGRFADRLLQEHRGLGTLLKWQLRLVPGDDHTTRPRWPKIPAESDPVTALRRLGDEDSVTWLGHSGVLLRLDGRAILIDPVQGDLPFLRRLAPEVPIASLAPTPDAILITHNHYDHMDAKTLRQFPDETRFVVPLGLGAWFSRRGHRNLLELDWWESTDVNGLCVTFVPARHWSKRSLFDTNDTLWGGYLVEAAGRRIYHAGDSGYFDGFVEIAHRFGGVDVAFLPIGAYAPSWFMRPAHMDPAEAIRAAVDLRAGMFIPIHFGTYRLSDEPLTEPPAWLEVQAANAGFMRYRTLHIGGTAALAELAPQGSSQRSG